MWLYDLLNGVRYRGDIENKEISDVCSDSRKIKSGCVFVCIKGGSFDGHDYARTALENGAAVVVCERDLGLSDQIICDNTHLAYAVMCGNFFDNPGNQLRKIGVTGTNGKTTTTKIIKNILMNAGVKTGLIGTIQNEIGDEVIHASKTTPDAYELQSLFKDMVESGCDYVVMEVSSHALDQYRVGGVHFDIAVFTNLTQDHLDYHVTMENYYNAKKMLFDSADTAVINIDDDYGKRLIDEIDCRVYTYSAESSDADFYADNAVLTPDGVEFMLKSNDIMSKINFSMPGHFSVLNALAAAAAAIASGICVDKVVCSLNSEHGVKGRSEIIPTGRDFTVICDYAHTPDGLENILPSVRGYLKGRLITVFGCGGDRDRGKRPLMAAAAAKYSDYIIVTSDNPRSEDPMAIIEDIVKGFDGMDCKYEIVCDRKQAIFRAVKIARKDDIIVLAGKGHEDYQVLADRTIHLDEREIVAKALKEL